MKNVTVTLDEKTATWARSYAARNNLSLSRFLGELLHQKMRESREYENAMRRYFEVKSRNLSGGKPYPARDDLYDR